jgi:hypothetical protein
MLKIVGVHTVCNPANAISGHAWLSFHFSTNKWMTMGLFGNRGDDAHNDIGELLRPKKWLTVPALEILDPPTYDVYIDVEKNLKGDANRFYGMPLGMGFSSAVIMNSSHSWRYSYTCASWAEDVLKKMTDISLDGSALGTQTPCALQKTIQTLEAKDPTSLAHPHIVNSCMVSSRG